MPHLERLRADHAPAVLSFELANRKYFAASVTDRGDEYFAEFDARLQALLDEQDKGLCHFHVIVDEVDTVIGRVNLVDVEDGSAELGYRIAEAATGCGLATWAVRELFGLAASAYGLDVLWARTTHDNVASRAVLVRNGFVETGEAEVGGRAGVTYVRKLAATS